MTHPLRATVDTTGGATSDTSDDRTAAGVAWDIEPLLEGADIDTLVDRAETVATHAEEPVGLDDLKGLVGQRGRVDRHLGAHAPRRVFERHLRRGVVRVGAAEVPQRAAGGCQNHPLHLRARVQRGRPGHCTLGRV